MNKEALIDKVEEYMHYTDLSMGQMYVNAENIVDIVLKESK